VIRTAVLAIALACGVLGAAEAQSLRSDSPLWTYDTEPDPGLYPEHFTDAESFGCATPFRLGIYRSAGGMDDTYPSYMRIDNYGVFHCALIFGTAEDLEDAEKAFEDHAWLIVLGTQKRPGGGEDELLALQIGVRAGSEYMIFKRRKDVMSPTLEELDWRCPVGVERRTARLDIWVQDVCVISTKADLRRIANAAARRPAVIRWELMPRVETIPSEPAQR